MTSIAISRRGRTTARRTRFTALTETSMNQMFGIMDRPPAQDEPAIGGGQIPAIPPQGAEAITEIPIDSRITEPGKPMAIKIITGEASIPGASRIPIGPIAAIIAAAGAIGGIITRAIGGIIARARRPFGIHWA